MTAPAAVSTPLWRRTLAVFAFAFAGVMAFAGSIADGRADGGLLFVRAAAAVLCALGLIAAEALWRARPWAFRASAALAGAYLLTCWITTRLPLGPASDVAVFIWLGGVFHLPAVVYARLRERSVMGRLAGGGPP